MPVRALRAHPAAARAGLLVTGSLAAAYVWAVLTGNGLHGLKGVAELDKTGQIPDANLALVAALGVFFVSCLTRAYLAATPPQLPVRGMHVGRSFAVCAAGGAAVFLVALAVATFV